MNRTKANAVIRWALPLLLTAGTVYAVYLAFLHIDFTPTDDGWILSGMGAAYLIAATFLLIFTRRWELKSLGQVVTYLADGGLYLGLGLSALAYRHPLSMHDQDVIRAGFVVGGLALTVGLFIWAAQELGYARNSRRQEMFDPTPAREEGA